MSDSVLNNFIKDIYGSGTAMNLFDQFQIEGGDDDVVLNDIFGTSEFPADSATEKSDEMHEALNEALNEEEMHEEEMHEALNEALNEEEMHEEEMHEAKNEEEKHEEMYEALNTEEKHEAKNALKKEEEGNIVSAVHFPLALDSNEDMQGMVGIVSYKLPSAVSGNITGSGDVYPSIVNNYNFAGNDVKTNLPQEVVCRPVPNRTIGRDRNDGDGGRDDDGKDDGDDDSGDEDGGVDDGDDDSGDDDGGNDDGDDGDGGDDDGGDGDDDDDGGNDDGGGGDDDGDDDDDGGGGDDDGDDDDDGGNDDGGDDDGGDNYKRGSGFGVRSELSAEDVCSLLSTYV
jgi:hypothetical protein